MDTVVITEETPLLQTSKTEDVVSKGTKKQYITVENNVTEVDVPVLCFCLVKQIVDEEGDLCVIGTLVQYVSTESLDIEIAKEDENKDTAEEGNTELVAEEEEEDEKVKKKKVKVTVKDINELFFQYRFNDLTAYEDSGMIQPRMTQRYNNDALLKKTFQFKAPLDVTDVFDGFPFKIVTGSFGLELSSSSMNDGTLKLRPHMVVSTKDRRNNISLQVPLVKDMDGKEKCPVKKKMRMIRAIEEQLDKSKKYELLKLFPNVEYFCDPKKGCCSKYSLQFYLVEEGISKLVQIIAPMLFIAAMNTLNVLDDQDIANADFLANAATFALTAVFILPFITGKSNRTELWTLNNLYILLVFIGLTLSSFPEELVKYKHFSVMGMIVFWCSFLIPLVNVFFYWAKIYSIPNLRAENFVDVMGDYEKRFNPKKDEFNDCFKRAKEVLEEKMNYDEYKEGEKLGKFDILVYQEK